MAEASGWTMVRLRAATKERLRALARRLSAAAQRGAGATPASDQPCSGDEQRGVTLDSALNRALDVYERQLAHGARHRRRPGGDDNQEVPEDHDPDPPVPDPDPVPVLGEADVTWYVGYIVGAERVVRREGPGGAVWDLPPHPCDVQYGMGVYSWGYWGTGPTALARAILADAIGLEYANHHWRRYLSGVLWRMDPDRDWRLSLRDVQRWCVLNDQREEGNRGGVAP